MSLLAYTHTHTIQSVLTPSTTTFQQDEYIFFPLQLCIEKFQVSRVWYSVKSEPTPLDIFITTIQFVSHVYGHTQQSEHYFQRKLLEEIMARAYFFTNRIRYSIYIPVMMKKQCYILYTFHVYVCSEEKTVIYCTTRLW